MGYSGADAKGLILSGRVIANGQKEIHSGILIDPDAKIEIINIKKYVARSAEKLIGALDDFKIDVTDRICIDLGSSTGGFVQVLLKRGAEKIYAVDVGYGILDYSLRSNATVVVLERHNVRQIQASWFQEDDMKIFRNGESKHLLITCDISFMSIRTVLKALSSFLSLNNISCEGIFLLKPQFEDSKNTKEGIITDETLRSNIVDEAIAYAMTLGFKCTGVQPAKIKGSHGNQEYVAHLIFQDK
jgi:23S rRNA (cytidine1920-2'-O)/16S rRNA (cytidine1409-2'-O)-methyltransferase